MLVSRIVPRSGLVAGRRFLSLLPPKDHAASRVDFEQRDRKRIDRMPLSAMKEFQKEGKMTSTRYVNQAKSNQLEREILEQEAANRTFELPVDYQPIWLVFDVNGTLGSRTKVRKVREKQQWKNRLLLRPRPFAGKLLQALDASGYFNLVRFDDSIPVVN